MKIKEFNKIGDTCFRVENQINGYLSFSKWFLEFIEEHNYEPSDTDFKFWAKESGIYEYGSNDRINRINIVKRVAIDQYKLISQTNKNKYVFNVSNESEIENYVLNSLSTTSRNEYDSKNIDESKNTNIKVDKYLPEEAFREMINFMINHPNSNDAKRLFLCFAVYEHGDNFEQMYFNQNLLEELVYKSLPNDLCKDNVEEFFKHNFWSRKPSESLKAVAKRILDNKNSFIISSNEFKSLKKAYLESFDSEAKFNWFVRNTTLVEIARTIFLNNRKNLLENEYIDLFNRLMWGLGLSESKSRNCQKYFNEKICKDSSGKFFIKNLSEKIGVFPYTELKVNEYLNKIQNENFDFMKIDRHLCSLPRADIVEYFVNLKFCYLLKIDPKDTNSYVNTNLDRFLYPTSHASGGKADMMFTGTNENISIETTIHNTTSAICNHEAYPSITHIEEWPKNKMKHNTFLFLIQPRSHDDKIIRWFKTAGEGIITNYQNRTFNFKTLNFEELAKLNSSTFQSQFNKTN